MSVYPDALVTPVLDTGKRADEGPPPSLLWSNTVYDGLAIAGGCFVPTVDDDYSLSVFNALECGPDCEVHVRIVEVPTGGLMALWMLDPLTGNGYRIEISITGSSAGISRITAWSDYALNDITSFTTEAGGAFRFVRRGESLKAYYKPPGGLWMEILSGTDSTYNAPCFLAVSFQGATDLTGKFENFGGGTLFDNDAGLIASVYQAKLWLQDDNSEEIDRYLTCWFKNGEPIITGGITDPTIEVIQASDGADLIAEDDMTEIASTGLYRYDEATNRVADGAAYIAKVTAMIDGATRTWYQPVGRDSAA